MAMRILHVVNSLPRAGAEIFLVRLAQEQVKAGAEVTVLALGSGDEKLVAEATAAGVKVDLWHLLNILNPLSILRLRKYLSDGRYDVVHSHLFPAQYWVAAAAKALPHKPKLITTEHSTHNRRRENFLFKPLESLMYQAYDGVVCISQATQDQLLAWVPAISNRARVINNGISFAAIEAAPPCDLEKITGLRRPIILCVGRLEHAKGQDALINAMRYLPEASLLLVGRGSKLEKWRKLAVILGVDDRVNFFGASDRVYELMKSCDVYVQPSRWEGFGIAALEAIACGARVVTSDVPGLSDVVRGYGKLIPLNETDTLVSEIRKSYNTQPCQLPRNYLVEMYSLSETSARHLAYYESMLSVSVSVVKSKCT